MDRRNFLQRSLVVGVGLLLPSLDALAMGRKKSKPAPKPTSNPTYNPPPPTPTPTSSPSPTPQPSPSPTSSPVPPGAISVRDFGARGDGVTNDTDAFKAASDEIMRKGGGMLYIPAGTYLVGKQLFAGERGKEYSYRPLPIIEIRDCAVPVVIQGERGAKLVATSGLKFGSFDPITGEPHTPTMPFTNFDYQANAYTMVNLRNNADVTVADLELDGNIHGLHMGGQWGDTGWQVNAIGVLGIGNKKTTLRNIYTHHHGQDGVMIGHYGLTSVSAPTPVVMENVVSTYNARQAFSWVGGIGLTATSCKFNHTGKARFSSAPGAGVDIEAEESICRDGVFTSCEFSNNTGANIVADSGDSSNMTFRRCSIWSTSTWAVWARKPYMRFEDCDIHGPLVQVYGSVSNPDSAAKFIRCTIDDQDHPVYGPNPKNYVLLDMGAGNTQNVLFDGCTITANRQKALYVSNSWTDNGGGSFSNLTWFRNCTISHRSSAVAAGDFQSVIAGVGLENTRFTESLTTDYYIAVQWAQVGNNVIVDGPHVNFQGKTGTIPPGVYKMG